MSLITIITPTYNRGHKLIKLFDSLQSQTDFDFEWMIVDDGSIDNTCNCVQSFINIAKFRIHYLKKENGGKHTALNLGIREIDTELTFIVDSDDTVPTNAIETIKKYYMKYAEQRDIGVFSFLRENTKYGVLVKMPRDEFVGSYINERIREERPGDMAEVFLTKALKEFPFPEFPGEKFLSEDVVWIPLGMKYKTLFINKIIYYFEYLDDGLTRNDKRHKFASPLGSMMRGKMLMNKACGWKARIKGAIIYNCYKHELKANIPECLDITNPEDRMLTKVMYPMGVVFNKKWKRIANG